ncbi:MAG: GNAT family N-acetyltransferase [Algicola sp.]|nr:GNAT family N-acetyltransferase [Algicola sp.]
MLTIRDYQSSDADAINALAVKAFSQYSKDFHNWTAFSERAQQFSSLSNEAEIIVATINDEAALNEEIVAAVAYVGAAVVKPSHFPANTPIIRMLVTSPDHRGLGLGKKLTQQCIDRAIKDKCDEIALHTSPIMTVALSMYLRMGFERIAAAPDIEGVKYGVYVKKGLHR